MKRSLVNGFVTAKSWAMAHAIRRIIVIINDFTDEEKASIRQACVSNTQVSGAGIAEDIYKVFGRLSNTSIQKEDDIPF
jgi:hypothetical protein